MSTKRASYVLQVGALGSVDPEQVGQFLAERSNLPGPRGNLELAEAFADWASAPLVDGLAAAGSPRAAAGGDEFVDCCIALALGERLARSADPALVTPLREIALDPRWRVREAVATGMQRLGDHDFPRLRAIALEWAVDADPLAQRAAAAAICEPRLLATPEAAASAAHGM